MGAGRKKNEPEAGDIQIGKGFATRVLERIGELGLRAIGPNGKPGEKIKTVEDYVLDILAARDAASRDMVKLMLAYRHGKPVQPTIQAGSQGEAEIPLNRGNLPSHFRSAHAGGSDKPN